MTKKELFSKADYYRDLLRKETLTKDQITELDNYYRIDLTYNNNSMEGNALTLTETKIFLEEGTTVGGKPMKDYNEAAGHAQAYDYMLSIAKTKQLDITEEVIKKLHYLYYYKMNPEEAGQYRKTQVNRSFMKYSPPKAEEIPHFMEHFMNQMKNSKTLLHPIEYAAICHKRLMDIQPFNDGNGIIARLLMNLILISAGYGIASIPQERYKEYVNALVVSQGVNNPDIDAFIDFVATCVIDTQRESCKILNIVE